MKNGIKISVSGGNVKFSICNNEYEFSVKDAIDSGVTGMELQDIEKMHCDLAQYATDSFYDLFSKNCEQKNSVLLLEIEDFGDVILFYEKREDVTVCGTFDLGTTACTVSSYDRSINQGCLYYRMLDDDDVEMQNPCRIPDFTSSAVVEKRSLDNVVITSENRVWDVVRTNPSNLMDRLKHEGYCNELVCEITVEATRFSVIDDLIERNEVCRQLLIDGEDMSATLYFERSKDEAMVITYFDNGDVNYTYYSRAAGCTEFIGLR